MIKPVTFGDNGVALLDQRLLPHQETWIELDSPEAVATAITDMVVRGAPAIGIAAGFGMALAARAARGLDEQTFRARLDGAAATLTAARPTAVNLAWAVERVRDAVHCAFEDGASVAEAAGRAEHEAIAIKEEDIAGNRAMGRHGSMLVPDGARVLTHCNAGALATGGYGTALGVVRAAVEEGKKVSVIADETRPYLQGSRLTAWELQKDGIPVTVIADSMAGSLLARGEVDLIVVGADRIARNGDVANKIGTYPLAVLARRHGVPFYVAAPLSTFDAACPSGDAIPIEERSADEVTHLGGTRLVPEGVSARHPAFDVTPAAFVTAIVTEAGIVRPPFASGIARLLGLEAEPAPHQTDSRGTDDDDESEVETADTAAALAAEGSDGEESSSRSFGSTSDGEEEPFP
jgi:methylthioribose-1-phosphate isomerase